MGLTVIAQTSVNWAAVGPILGLGLVVLFVVFAFLKYLSENSKLQAARDERMVAALDRNSDAAKSNAEITARMHEAVKELAREIRNGRKS